MNKSHPEEIITRYTQYKTITSDPQEKLSFKTQYIVQRVELKWGEIPPKLIRSGCEDPRTAWVKPDVEKFLVRFEVWHIPILKYQVKDFSMNQIRPLHIRV